MKLFGIILSGLFASSAFAATPQFVNCADEDGRVLEIKVRRGAIYQVSLKDLSGQIRESYQALLRDKNSDKQFLVETTKDGSILYAGYNFDRKEGFYGESANGGMSPMPAIYFKDCALR